MISRLWWMAVSYGTRPIVLAFIAAGILFWTASLVPSPLGSNNFCVYPPPPTARLMVDSKAKLDEVRQSGRQQEVDGIALTKLWFDVRGASDSGPPDEKFYEILDEFPNLRIVKYSYFGDAAGLKRIAALTKVEYVSIDGIGLLDIRPLESLQRLRRMDIGLVAIPTAMNREVQPAQSLQGIDALASLPNFNTLLLGTRSVVTDAVLQEVGTLPHLAVLVLDLADSPRTPMAVTTTGFEALEHAPALRTLYLGGCYTEDYRELVSLAKASLPQASLLSSRNEPNATVPFLILLPCYWLGAAIGLQLASEFSAPGSRLIPRFAVHHAMFATALATGVIALGTKLLTRTSLTLSASFAVSAAMVSVAIMGNSEWTIRKAGARLMPRFGWIGRMIFATMLVSLLLPPWIVQTSWLNKPEAVLAYVLTACFATALTVWGLYRLVEWSDAASVGQHQGRFESLGLRLNGPNFWMISIEKREREIEIWSHAEKPSSLWERIQHWRMGNPPFWTARFTILVAAICTFPIAMTLYFNQVAAPLQFLVTTGVLLAVSVGIAKTWRLRLPVLPLEFLRPQVWQSMRGELALAFAIDLLPMALLFAVVNAIGITMEEVLSNAWWTFPASVLIFFAIGYPCAIVVAALLVTVRRTWLAALLVIGFFLVNMQAMIWTAVVHQAAREIPLWIPTVSGALISGILWWRWRHVEIDQWA